MPKPFVTYRDLRNTPGRVLERLGAGETLALVDEGETKAILIPVVDGDAATALEAWYRGRAWIALERLRVQARATGTDRMPMKDITADVASARKERRRERGARATFRA